MRRIIGTAAAVALLLIGVTPAHAMPTATTQMSIVDATKGACSAGMATWTVHPHITINNDSTGTDEISNVFYTGKYSVSGAQVTTQDARATDTDGLEPGVTIAAGQSAEFFPTVAITIACDAAAATLFVNYDLVDGHKTFTGGAQFLSAGTAVPTGAVGALGLIGLVGVAALVRRRKPAEAKQPTVTG